MRRSVSMVSTTSFGAVPVSATSFAGSAWGAHPLRAMTPSALAAAAPERNDRRERLMERMLNPPKVSVVGSRCRALPRTMQDGRRRHGLANRPPRLNSPKFGDSPTTHPRINWGCRGFARAVFGNLRNKENAQAAGASAHIARERKRA